MSEKISLDSSEKISKTLFSALTFHYFCKVCENEV